MTHEESQFESLDIQRVAETLGVTLPEDYVQMLRSLQPDDIEYLQYDLFTTGREITESNQELRKTGFFGQKWPAHYLAIGSDPFGNLYFLDLSTPGSAVFLADHEATVYSDRVEACIDLEPIRAGQLA